MTVVTIYDENVEWVFSGAGTFNPADVSLPHTGVIDLKATASLAADEGKWKSPVGYAANLLVSLSIWIAKSGIWSSTTSLVNVYFLDESLNVVGSPIVIKDGAYGFSSSTSGYQNVVVPIADFALPDSSIVRYLAFSTGTHTTLSYFLDTIQLTVMAVSTDPSTLANAARCFSSCIPDGMAVKSYLLLNYANLPTCSTPTSPDNAAAANVTTTTMDLSWTEGASPSAPVTGFRVIWGTSVGSSNLGDVTIPAAPLSYTLTGLPTGTQIFFAIYALSGACQSANSTGGSATTQTPNGLLNSLGHFYRFQEAAALFADVGSSASNTPLNYTNAGLDFSRVAGHVETFAGNYDGSNGFNCVGTLGAAAPQDFGGGGLGTTPVTFAIWFKPSNTQPNNARTCIIIGTWDDDSNAARESWVVTLNAADNTKCQMFTRDNLNNLHFTALVGNISLNNWNFLCGGWDSGSNTAWLSLNGGARVTVAQTSINTTVGGARFNVANMFGPQRETNMSFESVGVWQRNFTGPGVGTDIDNLYNGGAGLPFGSFTV